MRALTYNNTNTGAISTATRTLAISVNDGQGASDFENVTVTVVAVNDAPVNTKPGAQTVNEDTNLTFSAANGNLISVADVDIVGGNLTVTLTVSNGTLTLSQSTGLSFAVGGGINNTTMTFTGTATNINAALNGVTYRGNANFNGGDTLTITTNDNGNTGSDPGTSGTGTTEEDQDTVAITVSAVNDSADLQRRFRHHQRGHDRHSRGIRLRAAISISKAPPSPRCGSPRWKATARWNSTRREAAPGRR